MADENDAADKAKDRIIEIQSSLFSKSTAYANLILLGGYAGAFTIWSNTKTQLSGLTNISIGTLLTISLAVFILFEVFKMARQALHFRNAASLIRLAKTPQEFLKLWAAFDQENLKRDLLSYYVWVVCLGICIVTALLAGAIMLYNFNVALFSGL